MLFDDRFQTISGQAEAVFSDRGSKFIGMAFPVSSEKEVKDILAEIRSAHPKARHFCWALRLSPDRSVYRVNDDGEPSGSAGKPILNVLLSKDLTDTLIVVVRYFGGTLLGISGLINAYKTAAEHVINEAVIVNSFLMDMYEIRFDYAEMNDVMRIIKDESLDIIQQNFDNRSVIQLKIRRSRIEALLARFEKIPSLIKTYIHA